MFRVLRMTDDMPLIGIGFLEADLRNLIEGNHAIFPLSELLSESRDYISCSCNFTGKEAAEKVAQMKLPKSEEDVNFIWLDLNPKVMESIRNGHIWVKGVSIEEKDVLICMALVSDVDELNKHIDDALKARKLL